MRSVVRTPPCEQGTRRNHAFFDFEPVAARDVAQDYVTPDLRKLHVFVSDPARSHLRPAEAPSAQIGLRSDLEMVTPEVAMKSASRNVVALKNKMGHQVDADGKRR